jgi:transcriptional regulator with XRE-family HTH domain
MTVNDSFRENLRRIMLERGMNPAQLSVAAGKNRRMVNDILESRAESPKLSTVVDLAGALGCDVSELLGFGPKVDLSPRLAALLRQYDKAAQEQLATALSALPPFPGSAR